MGAIQVIEHNWSCARVCIHARVHVCHCARVCVYVYLHGSMHKLMCVSTWLRAWECVSMLERVYV